MFSSNKMQPSEVVEDVTPGWGRYGHTTGPFYMSRFTGFEIIHLVAPLYFSSLPLDLSRQGVFPLSFKALHAMTSRSSHSKVASREVIKSYA